LTTTRQPASTKPSRRALLAAALGGIGAWAAGAVGHPRSALASDPNDVVLGGSNVSTATTSITNNTNSQPVFEAVGGGRAVTGSSSGIGVLGESTAESGVFATTDASDHPASLGLSLNNSTGVLGHSSDGSGQAPGSRAKTGVFGYAAQDADSRGVVGETPAGHAIHGASANGVAIYGTTDAGTGLYGESPSGWALHASGRIKFSLSGVALIAAGSTSKTITPGVNITSGTFVLLTPQSNVGSRALWFTTDVSNDRFTIRMSSARSWGTRVAWLLVG
jgi:hypothetical protein